MEQDLPDEVLRELMEMDNSIKKAEEKLEYLSSDPVTVELYKKREESLHERANMISSAKEDGRIEGKQEKTIEVALAALKKGLPIDIVSDITGLSVKELQELLIR